MAALDSGAAGVISPHISSAESARQLVELCRYGGRRGFSSSNRAGGYGDCGMWEHVDISEASAAEASVLANVWLPTGVLVARDSAGPQGFTSLPVEIATRP